MIKARGTLIQSQESILLAWLLTSAGHLGQAPLALLVVRNHPNYQLLVSTSN